MTMGELIERGAPLLRHITRWNNYPRNRAESVAEHSYYVALYALQIAQRIVRNCPHVSVNFADVLVHALTHDFDELETGDVHKWFKIQHPVAAVALQEAAAPTAGALCKELAGSFTSSCPILTDMIVGVADMAASIAYISDEVHRGNRSLGDFFHRMRVALDEARKDMEAQQESPVATAELVKCIYELVSVIAELEGLTRVQFPPIMEAWAHT